MHSSLQSSRLSWRQPAGRRRPSSSRPRTSRTERSRPSTSAPRRSGHSAASAARSDPRVRRDKRGRLGQPAHEGRPVRLDHKGRKAQPGRADGPSLRLRNRNGSASAGRPTGFSAVWRSVRGSGGKWLRYAVPSVIRVTVPLPSIGPVVGRLDTDWALLRGAWQQDRTSDELAFVKARREGAGGRFAPGPYRLGAAVRSRREEARTGWRFLSGSNAKTGHPPTHRR